MDIYFFFFLSKYQGVKLLDPMGDKYLTFSNKLQNCSSKWEYHVILSTGEDDSSSSSTSPLTRGVSSGLNVSRSELHAVICGWGMIYVSLVVCDDEPP